MDHEFEIRVTCDKFPMTVSDEVYHGADMIARGLKEMKIDGQIEFIDNHGNVEVLRIENGEAVA